MQYFLGADIGTTSFKAIAFDCNGNSIFSAVFEYPMQHPLPGYSEQDPVEVYCAVLEGIEKVIDHLKSNPAFICFSAAMHSIMAVDTNGLPLTPLLIWADNRAKHIAAGWHTRGDAPFYYQRTGVPVHAMSPLVKLAWIKENQPGIFHDAHKFIGIKEYVMYRLTGEFVVDTSIASATGLLSRQNLDWDSEILQQLGINSSRLSQVVSSKSVYYVKPGKTPQGLLEIPLVIGASDGALANLGAGATGSILAVTIGTSGAARLMVKQPQVDAAMRTFCYHVKDDIFIIGGGNNNGAVVLQWLKEDLLETGESFEQLLDHAAEVPAGAEGLIMLPFILGERAPLWNPDAKGVFFGITKQHTRGHFVRAVLEAVVFSMYSISRILIENNPVSVVYASGGMVKSGLWLQVMADVFGLPVHVSGAPEASAFGAVILGAEALSIPFNFESRIIQSFYPSEANFNIYLQSFNKYERLYAILKDEMNTNG